MIGDIRITGNVNECVKERYPSFESENLTSTKRQLGNCETELLLFPNRKWYTGYRLVPKSVTLNDLEGHNDCRRAPSLR